MFAFAFCKTLIRKTVVLSRWLFVNLDKFSELFRTAIKQQHYRTKCVFKSCFSFCF